MSRNYWAPSPPIPPTMMLLIGMWIIFTKKPTKPMIKKPIPVAFAIFVNSVQN